MSEQKDIVKRENVWSNGFISLEKVFFEKDGIEPHSHVRVVKRNAVAGLLYNTATEKYIFVKQYRTGTNSVLTEIIAGTMDVEGESAVDCLAREIEEEAGYKMTCAEFICVSHPTPGVCNEKIHVFFAETDGVKVGSGGGVGHENIEIVELTFDEMMTQKDLLNDMKTCIAILHHHNNKLKWPSLKKGWNLPEEPKPLSSWESFREKI